MSSGFVSESELAERRRVRQEEWEKVRQPNQPLGKQKLFVNLISKIMWKNLNEMCDLQILYVLFIRDPFNTDFDITFCMSKKVEVLQFN